jgi:hypothetical protein
MLVNAARDAVVEQVVSTVRGRIERELLVRAIGLDMARLFALITETIRRLKLVFSSLSDVLG